MKILLLCLNKDQYNKIYDVWNKIKKILKKYDDTCCFSDHTDLFSVEIVNKVYHTSINTLPAILIYPYYHYDKYQIYDSDIHTIVYDVDDVDDVLKKCHDYYESIIIKEHNELLKCKLQKLHFHFDI